MRAGTPLSLLMVDVDFFKRYNDAHGHLQGDACLVQVAQELANTARRAGDVVARYGGEEFGIILPDTDEAGARRVGELLCQRVRDLGIAHADSPVSPGVTISVGAASMLAASACGPASSRKCHRCTRLRECCDTPHELLVMADRALYAAKHAGRARVVAVRAGAPGCAAQPEARPLPAFPS
jgi:PleD family two-component response regulator